MAPTLKQPFIALDVVKLLKKAVATDPDHIMAKYTLAKFYATAPGFLGGDKDLAKQLADELLTQEAAYGCVTLAYLHFEKEEWFKTEEMFSLK